MEVLYLGTLTGRPVLAEDLHRMLQKLLLPLSNLVRMSLVTMEKFNDRLFSFQGV
jgi:hypothetical protein